MQNGKMSPEALEGAFAVLDRLEEMAKRYSAAAAPGGLDGRENQAMALKGTLLSQVRAGIMTDLGIAQCGRPAEPSPAP